VATERQTASRDPGQQFIELVAKHRRRLIGGAVAVIALGAGVWFVREYQQRRENAARQTLDQARFATQTGNLALAASDLSRLIASYGGTSAADEAVVILAQVRLLENQAALATQELRQAIDQGLDDQFLAPAYGLLGTALENLGNQTDAGEAYENAADASWYGFLAAQYLSDAGRAFANGGDTARAIAAYERIMRDHETAPTALEARVRLAELRAAGPSGTL
jgi:predicted negative regulator of RcsB-dependent stress response